MATHREKKGKKNFKTARSVGWRVPRYDLKAWIFYNLSSHFLVDYACLRIIHENIHAEVQRNRFYARVPTLAMDGA